MLFERIDDLDDDGNITVRYVLIQTAYSFEVQANYLGVKAIGETPFYTDKSGIDEAFVKAWYQHQRIKDTGYPISSIEEFASRLGCRG